MAERASLGRVPEPKLTVGDVRSWDPSCFPMEDGLESAPGPGPAPSAVPLIRHLSGSQRRHLRWAD